MPGAISQAVGVDGQLVGAWYRVSVAVARKHWGVALGFVVLGLLLAYVAYIAALVFATQQTYQLAPGQALARLGMDSTAWLWQRSAVSVLLVCLSGYLRYRVPRKQTLSLEERKRAIQEQMQLDALRQDQREQQARGAVHLLRGVVQAARGQDASDARHGGVTPETAEEQEVNAMSAAPLSTSSAPLPMAWLRVPTVPTSAANSASALNNGNSHK